MNCLGLLTFVFFPFPLVGLLDGGNTHNDIVQYIYNHIQGIVNLQDYS